MNVEWVEGFEINVSIEDDGAVVINANREGLLSLARQFTAMAEAMDGTHIHYDENNSLEEGSTELIVVKKRPVSL